jgi:hypothetical protein
MRWPWSKGAGKRRRPTDAERVAELEQLLAETRAAGRQAVTDRDAAVAAKAAALMAAAHWEGEYMALFIGRQDTIRVPAPADRPTVERPAEVTLADPLEALTLRIPPYSHDVTTAALRTVTRGGVEVSRGTGEQAKRKVAAAVGAA